MWDIDFRFVSEPSIPSFHIKRNLQYKYRRKSSSPKTTLSGHSVSSKAHVLNIARRGKGDEEPVDLPHMMDKHNEQASQVEGQENEYTEKTGFHIHRFWGERNSFGQLVLGNRRAVLETAPLKGSASITSILKS